MKPELPSASVVPFVVSVTGHRDLRPEDMEALRAETRQVFAGMRERMPHTELALLGGLAEGADQLAAEVAVECGVVLIAVLPMKLDIYRTTMSAEAQAKLDALLPQAVVTIVLPQGDWTDEQLRTDEAARAWCYESLAEFLARHGQALIALWDGKRSDKLGGTARVVHAVRTGRVEPDGEQTESSCGVVYQILTNRVSAKGPPHVVRTRKLGCDLHPISGAAAMVDEEHGPMTMREVERNIDRFNEDAMQAAADDKHKACLIDEDKVALSPFQLRLQTLYGLADAISLHANHQRKRFLLAILITAVCGTVFYGVHGEVLDKVIWLWLSFPAFVIAALALHWIAQRMHVEERYLDARALAEALRVQFFWAMAGIRQSVDQYYLKDRRTELDWIRFALKNIWLLHQGEDEDHTAKPNCRVVLERWVVDQQNWYARKARQQMRSVRRREEASRYGLIAAVVWSVLVPASIVIQGPWSKLPLWSDVAKDRGASPYFHIALAIPALLAAAYKVWIEQEGYQEQAREYRFMERQFAKKAKQLALHLDSPELAEQALVELGVQALEENGKWLLLHREHPLEVLSSP